MAVTIINGPVIEAGQAVSDAADLAGGLLARITMPAGWTRSHMSFLVSADGQFFNWLADFHGEIIRVPCNAGTSLIVPPEYFRSIGFLKIASGTREYPVPQAERREFALAVEPATA